MDANRFDTIIRSRSAGASRRGISRALAGLALFGPQAPLLSLTDTAARKRKKKGKGKKKKKGGNSPTCFDGKKNGSETGVDCGGDSCPRCATGQGCFSRDDCASAICTGGTCQACPTFGAPCGSDADGNCFCERPITGPIACFKTDEEDTVGSCSECAANTTCTNITPSGSVDCRKLCGAS